VLSETEEGEVFEEWVGKRQFLALRFCHGRLNGSAFNNLAGALHTDRVACTLSVGREVKMEIPVKMDGREPAGIVLDPVANRLYVGMGDVVNGVSVVKVANLNKRAIVAEWSTAGGPQPHVAGLDAEHHRLFMGSRLGGGHNIDPGKLVIMDTDTGKVIETLDAVGGGDEIFYDAPTKRTYFSGSTGSLDVFHEDHPNHFVPLGQVPTGAIAKSGIWIPELKRYYATVPKHLIELMPVKQYGVHDWITEEAHMMVFEELPYVGFLRRRIVTSASPKMGDAEE